MRNLLLIAFILSGLNSPIIAQTNFINHFSQTRSDDYAVTFTAETVSDGIQQEYVPSFSHDGNKVNITYVGNAGFLINIGDKKILIDALFKGFEGKYEIPQHIQEKLKLAQAPFDEVDLILVTHVHGDHFSPDMVSQHMKNNSKAIFASTQQGVEILDAFPDRCIAFNPSKEKSDKKKIQDFNIETFYLPHGPNSGVINIGFLVSVNRITFFQTGDADFDQFTFDEFRSLRLPEQKIDLSFIQHYYLRGDSLRNKFVREAIGGNYIIPIHYHFTTPTFDTTVVRENYPDAIIFKKELQSWRMPDKKVRFPILKNAYFGQKPPGLIPEVFAPGIVSDTSWAEHCQLAVSPEVDEIYWSAWSSKYPPADTTYGNNSEQIYFSELKKGEWSKPATPDFIKDHLTCLNGGPSFSPDGNRLYFYSTGIEGGFGEKDVWFVERTDAGWSKPINAGEPINTPDGDWTPSFTKNGNAYHMGNYYYNKNEKPLKFKFSNGKFSDPKPVIIHPDFKPFYAMYVSPDESYLIFSGVHKDGFGSLDLYISFKTNENKWGTPINMGDKINTATVERFPIVSPDGKYLFFMRHTNTQDIFWISTKIIKNLKSQLIN